MISSKRIHFAGPFTDAERRTLQHVLRRADEAGAFAAAPLNGGAPWIAVKDAGHSTASVAITRSRAGPNLAFAGASVADVARQVARWIEAQ